MSQIFGPKCPNHGVPLTDCSKGMGICPISGARFSYDADEAEKTKKLKIDALGGQYYDGDWKIKHVAGEDI